MESATLGFISFPYFWLCALGNKSQGANITHTEYVITVSILVSEDLQSRGIHLPHWILFHHVCVPLLAYLYSKVQKVSVVKLEIDMRGF